MPGRSRAWRVCRAWRLCQALRALQPEVFPPCRKIGHRARCAAQGGRKNGHFDPNTGRLAEKSASERTALRKADYLPESYRRPATHFATRHRSAVAGLLFFKGPATRFADRDASAVAGLPFFTGPATLSAKVAATKALPPGQKVANNQKLPNSGVHFQVHPRMRN